MGTRRPSVIWSCTAQVRIAVEVSSVPWSETPPHGAALGCRSPRAFRMYFGMKAHLSVDSRSTLINAVVATPANLADNTVLPDLLHGNETRVWGDQAYRGQRAAIRRHAPRAQDFVNRRYRHRGVVDEVERRKNLTKSKGAGQSRTPDRGYQAGVRL